MVIAHFASAEGIEDIGYQGNVPIGGDYPGPTEGATAHLETVLAALDLTDYAYPS